jgi:hypothetical protein
MSEKEKKEATRTQLALTKTRVGTANLAILADDATDTVIKDSVRAGAVVGLGYLVYTGHPVLVLAGVIGSKVLASMAARRGRKKLPQLEARAMRLKSELEARKRRKDARAETPTPDEVVPQTS